MPASANSAAPHPAGPHPVDLDPIGCALDGIHQIEASAGTGKTWNLSLLYLRLILERGLQVGQVLVVTFTKAATAELRERLRSRLVDTRRWLLEPFDDAVTERLVASVRQATGLDTADLVERVDNALAMFDESAIFTIHGFCQRALGLVPFAAGLPFEFEPMADDSLLCQQVAADFWRRDIAQQPLWPPLAELLLARRDDPARWADWLSGELERPTARRIWPDGIDGAGPCDLAPLYRQFEAARQAWDPGLRALLHQQAGVLKANVYSTNSINKACDAWLAAFDAGRDGAMADPATGRMDLLGMARITVNTLKKAKASPDCPFFAVAQAWLDERDRVAQSALLMRQQLMRRLLGEAAGQLRDLKRDARVVTYHDMLANLRDALADPAYGWLAPALRQQYPAALVDEFQDTDPLQFDIFKALYIDQAPSGPLFLIGDPKQAIYSFRGADLHVYLGAARLADNHFTLRRNQRSSPALISAVNALFTHNPQAFVLDGLAAQPVEPGDRPLPVLDDQSESAGAAALTLWRLPPAEDGMPLERPAASQMAANAVASEILRLLSAGARGDARIDGRTLAPHDIAVLVRSHSQGALMRRALAARGIDSVEMSQRSVFATPQAEQLETVLAALLEPTRASLVKAALATSLMGRNAQGIAALDADESALQVIIGRFLEYRRAWALSGFAPMIRLWMVGEGVDARLLERDDGERQLTDLLHLCELLQQAAQQRNSADALLRWLASQRSSVEASDDTQSRLESDRRLVRIVTIHHSKGLEYGIVFCPFLWDGQMPSDAASESVSYHDEQGNKVIDYRPESREDKQVKALRLRESTAEWVRLAYVALTRAVFRCYLVVGSYRGASRRTAAATAPSTRQSDHAPLNWLVAGVATPWPQWPEHKLGNPLIGQAWTDWITANAPHVGLAHWPAAAWGDLLRLAVPDMPEPVARAAPVLPPVSWRVASFSSLQATAIDELAGADHDARVPASAGLPIPESLAADDFLRFPRGPSAGDCLHAVFEAIDFTRDDGWPQAIAQALAQHPQRLEGLAPAPMQARLAAMLMQVVSNVLSTQLPGGFRLASVPRSRTLVELGFHLPAQGLDAGSLDQLLQQAGLPMSHLSFARLDGFLKGFIDLVFEQGGRYYIADWKSNFLGASARDYSQPRLQQAMDDHGYTLQYLLYTVALHRYLARRLPGYRYADHFGGVYYLFARGMRAGWVDDTESRPTPCGVYFRRPDLPLVQALDRWVGGSPLPVHAEGAA